MHETRLAPPPLETTLRVMLSLVLVFALGLPSLPVLLGVRSAEGATKSESVNLVRSGDWIEYDGYRTADMYENKTGYQIICAQPSKDSPQSGSYKKDYGGIDEHIEDTGTGKGWIAKRKFLVRALMYFTHPDSPGFDKTLFTDKNWKGEAWSRKDYVAMLHLGMSAAYDNSFDVAMKGTGQAFQDWVAEHITGGYSKGDEIDGEKQRFDDAVWGKLLHSVDGKLSGWNTDANPYYAELPDGYKIYVLHTGEGSQVCFGFDAFGWIEVKKKSSIPNISNGNRMYSTEGAVYGVYADKECTDEVDRITIGEDGTGTSGALDIASYHVKEISAPYSFAIDASAHQVSVKACKTTSVTSNEAPRHAAPDIIVQKLNLETGKAAAAGGASLAGAQFKIDYFDAAKPGGTPTRSWTFESDADGKVLFDKAHRVSGDALYEDENGKAVLPLGSCRVQETVAPEGYLLNTEVKTLTISCDDNDKAKSPVIKFDQVAKIPDQVMRGNVEFRKTDEENNGLAGIPFLLSYSNGDGGAVESHVIVTGPNGAFSTSAYAHSSKTNANDAALSTTVDGARYVDASKLDDEAGVWFSMDASGATAKVNDALGALPYGSYTLEELPCDVNHGLTMVKTGFTIAKDKVTVKLNNIVDKTPSIETSAADAADKDKLVAASKNAVVIDTVRYRNLIAGTAYQLEASLMDVESGQPVTDANGNAVCATGSFTATSASGTTSVSIRFDASGMPGAKLVVFEQLLLEGRVIASHEDIADADQSVTVQPLIHTSASDKADNDKYVTSTQATVTDAVRYEGLVSGDTYKLDARLMDKVTGNVARNGNGEAISASLEFVPEEAAGTAEVDIVFETSSLGGHDVVVYEKLLDEDDTVLATHEDLESTEQTVKTAGIDTKAYDKVDKDKYYDMDAKSVTIVDEVSYTGLEAGNTYTITATLMNKETGKALEGDAGVYTSTTDFTADGASGDTKIECVFSPNEAGAGHVVVYESLSYEGNEIAAHTDIDDADQTLTGLQPDEETYVEESSMEMDDEGKEDDAVDTGDDANMLRAIALIVVAAASFAGAAGIAALRNRKLKAASRDCSEEQ